MATLMAPRPAYAQDLIPVEVTYHWRSIFPDAVPPAPVLGFDAKGSGLYFETVDSLPTPEVVSGLVCFDIPEKRLADFIDPVAGPITNQLSTWRIRMIQPPPCTFIYRGNPVRSGLGLTYIADITVRVTNTIPTIVATVFAAPAAQTTTIAPADVATDADNDPLFFQPNGSATGPGCGAVSVTFEQVSVTPSAAGGACSVPVLVVDARTQDPRWPTISATLEFTTPLALPAVAGLAPASGPVEGGNPVVITGAFLAGATAVTFGPTSAGFTVDSATQITAIAPPSAAPGLVNVQVTTPAGASGTTAAGDDYTYASSNANLFANGFELPEINAESGGMRLAAASLRSAVDEVARLTVRLSDVRGEALRVYTRVIAGSLQVALAVRGIDGSLRLGSWQQTSGEPELSWTATAVPGGYELRAAALR